MSTIAKVTHPKTGTRQAQFLERLQGSGASMPDLMAAMGWRRHSVRAAMTGLRKLGFEIERLASDSGESTYRLKTAKTRGRRE